MDGNQIEAERYMRNKQTAESGLNELQTALRMPIKCPNNLLFVFECDCDFSRKGFEVTPPLFRVELCEKSKKAIGKKPSLGRKIAKACNLFRDIRSNFTRPNFFERRDEIFNKCPETWKLLCPGNKFKMFECICFLMSRGVLDLTPQPGVCTTDFSAMLKNKIRRLNKRCAQPRMFKNNIGGFYGSVLRNCFSLGDQKCCSAVPPQPSPAR